MSGVSMCVAKGVIKRDGASGRNNDRRRRREWEKVEWK